MQRTPVRKQADNTADSVPRDRLRQLEVLTKQRPESKFSPGLSLSVLLQALFKITGSPKKGATGWSQKSRNSLKGPRMQWFDAMAAE